MGKICCRKVKLTFFYTNWLALLISLILSSIPLITGLTGSETSLITIFGVVLNFVNMYIAAAFILSAKPELRLLYTEWTEDITALLSKQYSKDRDINFVLLLDTRQNIIAWSELRNMVYKKTLVEIYRVEFLLIALTMFEYLLLLFLTNFLFWSQASWLNGWLVLTSWPRGKSSSQWSIDNKLVLLILSQFLIVVIATLRFLIQFITHSNVLSRLWTRQSQELTKQRFLFLHNIHEPVGYVPKSSSVYEHEAKRMVASGTINTGYPTQESSSDRNNVSLVPSYLLNALIDMQNDGPTSVHLLCFNTKHCIVLKIICFLMLTFLPSLVIIMVCEVKY